MSQLQEFMGAYPEAAALVVVIAGLVVARLVSKIVGVSLKALDERLARYSVTGKQVVSPGLVKFGKSLSFWLVVFIAAIFAVSLLDITNFSGIIDGSFTFLGQVLFGLIILGSGHFLGLLAQQAVERLANLSGQNDLASKVVYGAILFIAADMALSQLAIDTSFLTTLLLLVVAVVLGGLMLAFALGARGYVANILAQTEMRRYSVGEKIKVDQVEGTILQIHGTGLDLQSAGGVVFVPAGHFTTSMVVRLATEESS
jgi:hypothetical protein